jgi:hypothetical protein
LLIIIICIIHQSSLDNEDFNGDNNNPSQDYNNYNENYNGDNDNSSLDEDYNGNNDNENYNGNNDSPSLDEDYNGDDNPNLDNIEDDKVEDIETESDISEENDELTEMDNKFKDIEDINDGTVYI